MAQALAARFSELEASVEARVYAISSTAEIRDPAYLEGLQASLAIALRYALAAIERGEERTPDIPPALLVQARMAARMEIGLETVLRRYFAGYLVLAEFVLQEASRADLIGGNLLERVLQGQGALFDRLIEAVSREYGREAELSMRKAKAERRAMRIKRLLAGEQIDIADLAYDFDGHHLGVVASGEGSMEAVRGVASKIGRSVLLTDVDGVVWAWLGGRRPFDQVHLRNAMCDLATRSARFGLGEPACGLNGWRLTHQQARAAIPFAQLGARPIVRYREVALLASMRTDRLLSSSLEQIFLSRLEDEGEGESSLRETLRAYFSAERSVTSAAAALGVKRHTVTNRLRAVEQRLGCSLTECSAELEAALRLEESQERSEESSVLHRP